MVKAQINPNLEVAGLLPTMVANNKDSRSVAAWLREEFPSLTFDSGIGRYVDAPRSVKARKPLIGTKSKVGEQYMAATMELLARLEG